LTILARIEEKLDRVVNAIPADGEAPGLRVPEVG
jgi:hypothetical protein